MPRNISSGACFSLLFLLTSHFFFFPGETLYADDADADQIAQTAARAQNAGDFELATTLWEQLIKEHPDYSQIGIAHYQAGYCQIQSEKFSPAIEHLEQAVKNLPADQTVSLGQSYLFLGYAESKLGKQLLDEDEKAAGQLLTTATQTFVTLLSKYPDFEDADQALYFQGEAFEALGRLDDAAESYTKMLQLPDPEFKLDGLYAVAFIKAQQGKYETAHQFYNDFEKVGEGHSSFNEVRFRNGEVLTDLALAANNLGEKDQRSKLLQAAADKFAAVYKSHDARWADQARFEQANCTQQLGQYEQSARLYDSVVQMPKSKLVDQARVYAGRDYLRAGKCDAALQTLEKAVSVPSPFAPVAAHWLAQFYIRSNQNDNAYSLARQWIDQTKDIALKVPLIMDQADAAYASIELRDKAADLYLQLVDQFPQHRLAAIALYNAAFAEMKTKKYDDALKLTKRFRSEHPQSDYLPDVLEVEGDSFLLNGDPVSSEKSFTELVTQFNDHPKSPVWKLRIGLAKYLQKNYEDTIAWLNPLKYRLPEADDKAESLHWIGSSQYQLGQTKPAVESLQESWSTSSNWRRADETLLTLSRALYADKRIAEAKKTTQKLTEKFPDSTLIAEAKYRLAEFDYEEQNYADALKNYVAVVESHGDSSFAPYSMYGIGWSQLQQNQFDDAAKSFSGLIESFPKHDLANQALIGRASSFRQSGSPANAIQDIDAFLASDPVPDKKEKAMYEKGLAQIALKKWPDVVTTFADLIEFAPDSELADRFNYELAWAHRENGNKDAALKYFTEISDGRPDSPLAAESNFHVAQAAYAGGDYDASINGFKDCVAKCKQGSKIHEKAIYKLAWSYYKKKDFDNALATFQQQVELFPAGNPLHADGLVMVSESLYESDKFEEAFLKYRVAKPVIETSTTVSPNYRILTYLHGAQSANKAGKYKDAIEFAESLLTIEPKVEKHVQQEAQMEMGDAYRGLRQLEKSVAAYETASRHPGKTGARSMSMVGEILFDEKKFDDAITKFKMVLYGYGGSESNAEVKPWQAFAAYEAGRCNFVQISTADDSRLKLKLIAESKKHFGYLVENFPEDKLAEKAQGHLKDLETIQ